MSGGYTIDMAGVGETGINIAALQGALNTAQDPGCRPFLIMPAISGIQGPFAALQQGWANKPIASVIGGKKGGGNFSGFLSWGDLSQTPIAELANYMCDVRQTDNLVAPPTPGGGSGGGVSVVDI